MGDPHPSSVQRRDAAEHRAWRRVARDPGEVLTVRLQGRDPALERVTGDVHPVRGCGGAGDEQPPRRPRLQALLEQLGEHPPVAGVPHRVHGGQSGHPVVGLVEAGGELHLPGAHEHGIGAAAPDRPGDVAAHLQRVDEHPVRVVEEVHLRHAHLSRRRDLLAHPQLGGLRGVAGVHAGLPASQQQVRDVDATTRPRRDRGRRPVLDVVGMGHHAQHALERVGRKRWQHPLLAHRARLVAAETRATAPRW